MFRPAGEGQDERGDGAAAVLPPAAPGGGGGQHRGRGGGQSEQDVRRLGEPQGRPQVRQRLQISTYLPRQ